MPEFAPANAPPGLRSQALVAALVVIEKTVHWRVMLLHMVPLVHAGGVRFSAVIEQHLRHVNVAVFSLDLR